MGQLAGTTARLAEKDWDAALLSTERTDEIGAMNAALQTFRENGQRADELEAAQEVEREKPMARSRQIEELATTFDRESSDMLDALTSAAAEMQATSKTMTEVAQETTTRAAAVSAGARDAGGNVQSVSATSEELTSSIREISSQVQKVNSDAGLASRSAGNAKDQITTLATASVRVGQIVAMITEIAQSVNMASSGTDQVVDNIAGVGEGAAATETSAQDVHQPAQELSRRASHMDDNIKTFLVAIRAA